MLASPQLTMPPNGSLSDAYTVGEGEGDGSPSSLRPILLSADAYGDGDAYAYGDGDAYGYGDGCRLQNMLLSTNWLGVALIHAATVKGAAPIGRFTLAPCAENRHDRPSSITSSSSVRMGGTEAKGGNGGGEGGGGNGGGEGGGGRGGGDGGGGDGGGGKGGGGEGGGGEGGGGDGKSTWPAMLTHESQIRTPRMLPRK